MSNPINKIRITKKSLPIILGVVLGIFVAVFLIGLMINSFSGGSAIKVVSAQDVFQSSENPQFIFVYKNQTNIFVRFFASVTNFFKSENKELSATIKILNSRGEEVDGLDPQIKEKNGKLTVDLNHSRFQQELRPGKYKIQLEINDNGKTYVQEQDFTWGVLAINTNKSIYLSAEARAKAGLPPEEVYLQLASLNKEGKTICNSNLKLEIQNPKSKIQNLSIEDGTIKYSGECKGDNVTDVPDYFAHYRVSGAGKYKMTLTNLDNGYSITDYFEVRNSVEFDIERIGPTRIYPPADYEMRIKIKANQDFEGEIKEIVPMTFAITPTDKTSPDQSPNIDNYTKTLTWQAKIKKGEILELRYSIDFPEISPYFYLLGPLKLYQRESAYSEGENQRQSAVFAEQRQWQIASDETLSLYVNTRVSGGAWTETGTTPYLNAQDQPTNYTYTTGRNDDSSVFGFADATQTTETINSVYLYIYAVGAAETNFDTFVNSTNTGLGPPTSWGWVNYNVSSILTTWSAINSATIYFDRPNTTANTSVDAAYLYVDYTPLATTISGTCKQNDQSTNCGDCTGCVKAAVNGTLDSASGNISGGSWTITLASTTPSAGNPITVFKDGVADANEAVAVTEWVSGTSLTGVLLYENHLNIGHTGGTVTISNTDISTYDNSVSGDEDIFFEASATSLQTCIVSGCESAELYIVAGNTFAPNTGGSSYVEAHDIEIDGTFNMTGTGNYASISGGWDNDGTFTYSTSTIFFTASDSAEIVSASAATETFYGVQFGDSATTSYTGQWTLSGAFTTLDTNNNLTIGAGTLVNSGTKNINLAGNLLLETNGAYTKGSGTFTFDGTSKTWTDSNSTKSDLGAVSIDGGGTITMGSSVKATSLNITAGDTFSLGGSYVLSLIGTGASVLVNSNTFTQSTGTVSYEGNGATTVASSVTYYGLSIGAANSANNTYSAGGNLTVQHELGMQSAASGYTNTLALGSNNLTVGTTMVADSGTISVPIRSAITQTGGTTRATGYSGSTGMTIGGAGNTQFYNFIVGTDSDDSAYTFTLAGDVGASGSFELTEASGHHLDVSASNYELSIWGNFTVDAGASISFRSGTLAFRGTTDTTYTNSGSCEPYNLILNKTGDDTNDDLNLSSALVVRNTLTITDGELLQTTTNVTVEGSTAVSVGASGEWNNASTGDLVLGGTFTNAGSVSFSANDVECTGGGTTDDISISTTDSSLKTWTNTGTLSLYNITASYQADASITCYSCTNSGTTSTWTFEACASPAVVSQAHFRWRDDNNGETNATWLRGENQPHSSQARSDNVRLRFSIANTGGAATDSHSYVLQVAPLGTYGYCEAVPSASYSDVPTTTAGCGSSVACMTTSTNFTNQASTTTQMTATGTFVAGKMVEDPSNQSDAIIINAAYYTEHEFNFQFTSNAANNTNYCFRVTKNGTLLDTYTKVAQITVESTGTEQGLITRLLGSLRIKGGTCFNRDCPPPAWACGDTLIDTRDSKSYATVQIDTQCWMAQGLNVGTRIDGSVTQDGWSGTTCGSIDKYCYDNTDANCDSNNNPNYPDGGLYQWDQAMCGSTTEGVQGICPSGWHIPTDAELYILESYLWTTGSCDSGRIKVWGCEPAGTALKPNGSSGFEGNLGGRYAPTWNNRNAAGFFWHSTQSDASNAYGRSLGSIYDTVYRDAYTKTYGYSVRCIKD